MVNDICTCVTVASLQHLSIANHLQLNCCFNNLFEPSTENASKSRITDHLCGESTDDEWPPRTNGQWWGKCVHDVIIEFVTCDKSHTVCPITCFSSCNRNSYSLAALHYVILNFSLVKIYFWQIFQPYFQLCQMKWITAHDKLGSKNDPWIYCPLVIHFPHWWKQEMEINRYILRLGNSHSRNENRNMTIHTHVFLSWHHYDMWHIFTMPQYPHKGPVMRKA